MDDLGIAPPPAPGMTSAEKKGFFSKLFKKKKPENVDDMRITADKQHDEQFDIDEIRRRVGLSDEQAAQEGATDAQDAAQSEFAAPEEIIPKDDPASAGSSPAADAIPATEPLGEPPHPTEAEGAVFPSEEQTVADLMQPAPAAAGATADPAHADPAHEMPAFDEPEAPTESSVFDDEQDQELTEDTQNNFAAETPEPTEAPSEGINWDAMAEPAPPSEKPDIADLTSSWTDEVSPEDADEASGWAASGQEQSEEHKDRSSWSDAWGAHAVAGEQPATEEQSPEPASAESLAEPAEPTDEAMSPPVEPHEEDELAELERLHEEIMGTAPPELAAPETTADSAPSDGHEDQLAELDQLHQDIVQSESQPVEQAPTQEAEPLAHHVEAEKAFASLEKEHEELDKQLEKAINMKRTEVPDWKYQKVEVTPDKFFKLKNGQEVTNFKDLMEALEFISDETFAHHVNENRNDFAVWVEKVLQEEKLAEQIRNKKAKGELIAILHAHEDKVLKELEKQRKDLEKAVGKKQKKVEEVRGFEKEFDALVKKLKNTSMDIEHLRKETGKHVKEKIDQHVENTLSDEVERIASKEENLNEFKRMLDNQEQEFNKIEQELAAAEEALGKEKSEHKLDKQRFEREIAETKREIEQERAKIIEERKESEMLLARADEIRKVQEEATKDKEAAKKTLQENKKTLRSVKSAQTKLGREEKKFKKKQEKLNDLQKSIKDLEADLKKRDAAMKKEESRLEKERKEVAQEIDRLKAERASTKEFVKSELEPLQNERKEVEKLLKELDKRTAEEEKQRQKNEDLLKEIRKAQKLIAKREEALQKHEAELEHRGFQRYLNAKLDNTVPGSRTDRAIPPVEEVTNVHLYKLIDQCKDALDTKDITGARKTYNTLRHEFSRAKLTSHEKSILYNAIRELYDDIHLTMLNQ